MFLWTPFGKESSNVYVVWQDPQKIEKFNNKTLLQVAKDPEAKISCKGKDKYGYGFQRFNSVDMQSSMINKVTITPANVSDGKGFKHVCPNGSIVYGNKVFCTTPAQKILRIKSCQNATIQKNNMKGKDFDQDRIRTKWRMPFERIFSKQSKRARYKGVVKNQFASFMEAMVFNLKRLVVLENQLGVLSLI